MARPQLRRLQNVDGAFFVDSTCIDCDACRQIAPRSFARRGKQSAVVQQPDGGADLLAAQQALLSCPTSSIGDLEKRPLDDAIESLPRHVDGPVYFCGFTSERSFGAISYLVVRDEGSLLVDSPRYNEPLVRRVAALGGVRHILLTHRDDIADHDKFSARFDAERVMHSDDLTIKTRAIERPLHGGDAQTIASGVMAIPTPGHTKGHVVFLVDDRYLFTGDHLSWDPDEQRLIAFDDVCWYSWEAQIESMQRLLEFSFEWVLPGHGRPVHLGAERMREELRRCVEWMRSRS